MRSPRRPRWSWARRTRACRSCWCAASPGRCRRRRPPRSCVRPLRIYFGSVFTWSHFLRKTGVHFSGKCSMSVVALSGGVGGAKLALGLSRILPPGELTVIANTGDDFEHLGLAISPDLDTLTYVLAGLDDQERGWGRHEETWTFMPALAALGGEAWFQLGDGDLAIHVERTQRLQAGERLSAITADFCRRLNIATRIIPMSDDKVRTRVRTADGWLDFQDYFVRRRCEPAVVELAYEG